MEEWLAPGTQACLIGLAAGGVLGLAARLGRFCTLGAIEDALFGQDFSRARLWVAAIASAILLTHLAGLAGWVNLAATPYLARPLNIPATIIGGGMFGVGMALVGTCGYGCLARLGGGDLRALLVFGVMAVAGFATLAGLPARLFAEVLAPLALPPGSATGLPELLGLDRAGAPAIALAVAVAMLIWCLHDVRFRRSSRFGWGVASGAAVAIGWVGTSALAHASFDAVTPRSLTFVRPLGETVLWVMTSTATPLSFGIGSVVGVVAGAFAGAAMRSELRWEAFDDQREMRRQLLGAVLMGVGGVFAFGCTIGQGLTAMSVLALSAPLAIASMIAGAWIGLTVLIEGDVGAPWRRLVGRSR